MCGSLSYVVIRLELKESYIVTTKLVGLGVLSVAMTVAPAWAQVSVGGAGKVVSNTGASLGQTTGGLNSTLGADLNAAADVDSSLAAQTADKAHQSAKAVEQKSKKKAAKHAKEKTSKASNAAQQEAKADVAAAADSNAAVNANFETSSSSSANSSKASTSASSKSQVNAGKANATVSTEASVNAQKGQ
jgi:hypothetical protein